MLKTLKRLAWAALSGAASSFGRRLGNDAARAGEREVEDIIRRQ